MLAAFGKYEVVGMGAAHGNKDLDDLILHLIRDPAFPNNVNDSIGCRQTGHFFCHILIPIFSSNRAHPQKGVLSRDSTVCLNRHKSKSVPNCTEATLSMRYSAQATRIRQHLVGLYSYGKA